MQKYAGKDHYLDLETGVLKNKLGIQDQAILEEREADYATARTYELAKTPLEGRFDLDHLKAIHKHLFGDVYAWAGELRDIDLAKGNSYFANHTHIVSAARPVFAKLADEGHLTGLDMAAFRADYPHRRAALCRRLDGPALAGRTKAAAAVTTASTFTASLGGIRRPTTRPPAP